MNPIAIHLSPATLVEMNVSPRLSHPTSRTIFTSNADLALARGACHVKDQ